MDNIGGIISAEYCFVDNIKSCAIIGSKIKLAIQNSWEWRHIQNTPGKIEITVTPVDETGSAYTVAGTIYCARFNQARYGAFTNFPRRKVLIKYTTANGDVLVVGDKQTPLSVKAENLNPSQANGYSGTKLTISGTMKHPELVLME